MNYYKNQEIQISGKFVGISDDGKVQVKINGIDNVLFNIDSKYINTSSSSSSSSSSSVGVSSTSTSTKEASKEVKDKKEKKKKKKTELDKAADDAWGASDDENDVDIDSKQDDVSEEIDNNSISIGSEKFHSKHKYKTLSVESEGSLLKTTESKSVMCGFGSFECGEEGKIYHWKIQILEGNDINLGVIFSDQCKKNKKQMWWLSDEGYSYWGDDGQIYHSDKYKKYGDKYGAGDIIDIWLNLKKYNISFAKNNEKYGKAFKVNKERKYRLGVGLSGHPHTLQLIQFEIQ